MDYDFNNLTLPPISALIRSENSGAVDEEDSEKRKSISQLVKRYFYQLTFGCELKECQNIYCSKNKKYDKNDAAALSLQLAKSGNLLICVQQAAGHGDKVNLQIISDLVRTAEESGNFQEVANFVLDVFSKIIFLNQSFSLTNHEHHVGLDLEQVRRVYEILIMKLPGVVKMSLMSATETLLNHMRSFGDFIEWHLYGGSKNPLLSDPSNNFTLFQKFIEVFNAAVNSKGAKNEVGNTKKLDSDVNYISENPKSELTKLILTLYNSEQFMNLVNIVQQFITMRLLTNYATSPNRDECIFKATLVLGFLYEINEQKQFIGYKEFYNETVNDQLDIKEDFPKWKGKDGFSFCDFPFILNPSVKSDILKVESMVQMRHELQDAFFRAMFSGITSPYLVLEIRRDFIIRDALCQLEHKSPQDLKKQLRVQFVGEEGVDEGGVQKEFFQLFVREMFDSKYGMFSFNEKSHLCWFTANSLDDLIVFEEYRLIGRVLGLSIYNSVILDVHFPMALYKKLVDQKPDLCDLRQFDPDLAAGLTALLEFEGNVADLYDRSFQAEFLVFGSLIAFDLKSNGANVKLTNENREEFVDLYVDFIFNKSVEKQFAAFKEGFDLVCGGTALQFKIFRAEELELLVCGASNLDFDALEKVTVYDGGYTKDTPVIRWFWQIVYQFNDYQKKRLLFFITGTDRAPIGGLAKSTFVVARNGPDCERLPTSHTCFNVLLLPEYSSKDKLQDRLLTAIQNAEGFGLI